ncbi:MAG: hypothetical protein JKY96_05335 [Phycisphaerales bacterium]|nr:hypothetical protein [Phycisphaerales bacterium]
MYRTAGPIEHEAMVRNGQDQYSNWDPSQTQAGDVWLISIGSIAIQKVAIRFYMSYASHKLEKGDAVTFVGAVDKAMRGARFIDEIPMFGWIQSQEEVAEFIDWALNEHGGKFTDSQLSQLTAALKNVGGYEVQFEVRSLEFRDAVRRLVVGGGAINPMTVRSEMENLSNDSLGPATGVPVAELHASVQRLIHTHEQILQHDISYTLRDPVISGWEMFSLERDMLGASEHAVLDRIYKVVRLRVKHGRQASEYSDAVRLAIAAYRHKLRHGEFPLSIGEMDEGLLGSLPLHVSTGESTRYSQSILGVTISSKLRDDSRKIAVHLYPKRYKQVIEDEELED